MKNIFKKIEENGSRIKSYVIYGDVGSKKTTELEKIEDIRYIDFEKELEVFFKSQMMSLNLFEVGVFFKYIEKLVDYNLGITVIDNLEGVQNVLYNLEKDGEAIKRFFESMMKQAYRGKVVFVVSNIKRMKIENVLEKCSLPEENILAWRGIDVN